MELIKKFRTLFVIGGILLFISIFLDWYHYIITSEEFGFISSWSFNFITEWQEVDSSHIVPGELISPKNISIPLAINILLILIIILAIYGVMYKDIEEIEKLNNIQAYSYVFFFLLLLNAFYIFIVPLVYLIPQELYFPILFVKDGALTYSYHIGLGFIMQCISFLMIFPYTVFFHKTLTTFENRNREPSKILHEFIEDVQEPIDFDGYIAKEELKLRNFPIQEELTINKKRRAER